MGPRTQLVVSLFVTPLFCRSKCSRSPFEYNKPWTGGYANWSQSWLVGAFWEQPLVSIYLLWMNDLNHDHQRSQSYVIDFHDHTESHDNIRVPRGWGPVLLVSQYDRHLRQRLRKCSGELVGHHQQHWRWDWQNSPPQANINNSNNISGPSVSV